MGYCVSTHGRSERSFSIRFVRRLPCQVEFDKSILNKLQSKYSQMASAAKGVPNEKVSEIKLNLPPRRCCAALNALTTVYCGHTASGYTALAGSRAITH